MADMALKQALTILIPTYNRYPMLLRVLRYIDAVKLNLAVVILDSSSDRPGIFKNAIETLIQKHGIAWLQYESTILPTQKINKGLEGVTTPYVVLWADDDFLILTSLLQEVKFLEEHADFSAVHGEAGIFTLSVCNGAYEVNGVSSYPQYSLMDETAVQRLIKHMEHCTTTFYSIHRTVHLRHHFALCTEHKFGWMWAEIFLSCLTVIEGKTRKTPYLHMLREVHDGNDSFNVDYINKDFFDWMVSSDFSLRYEAFRDVLVAEIVRIDGISMGEACEVVKHAFWAYLKKSMTVKFQQHYRNPSMIVGMKTALKRIYGVKGAWRFFQSMLISQDSIFLPSLLNPRSPYYEDFMPVYRAITNLL